MKVRILGLWTVFDLADSLLPISDADVFKWGTRDHFSLSA